MRCWACGAEVAPEARFCSSCGQDLRVRRNDERRVVTVLFADLVGFTSLSEHRDPEEVKGLVDRCFERLATDIEAFGGRVDKFVGDGVLALFGAPTAHEDDAERAVRAALRMQHTVEVEASGIGAPVQLRIGVNTGEVLVGALRAGGDYTAMGDVVNTAQRLQTIADPGTVAVGAATHAATAHVIEYEELGMRAAKGREGPLEVWRALDALLPPGYRPRTARTALVGRDVELDLLDRVVDAAVATRRVHLMLLLGEAGVGKSRLAEEVAERAALRTSARVLEGRCVPYGEANVWWPIAEAIRTACGLTIDEPLEVAVSEVRATVAEAMGLGTREAEVGRVSAGLVHLLGYGQTQRDADPGRVREEATRSLVVFLEALSARHPVVLILSDLHWADDVVLELLEALLARAGRSPIVVLGTARAEVAERWQPSAARGNTQVLHLEPLEDAAAGLLLEALAADLPAEVRAEVLDHSGGNPFFLEELVSLVSTRTRAAPDAHLDLPDTLRGLVAARLDNLEPPEARVVEDAAVWGRRGPMKALVQMGEEIHRLPDVPGVVAVLAEKDIFVLDGTEWAFRSDAIRDVAYQRLTKADRARRHHGIAATLAEHSGPPEDATDQALSVVAHHYAAAAELAQEVHAVPGLPADVTQEACRWLRQAASRQARAQRWGRALELFERAVRLLPVGAPESAPLQIGAARALGEMRRVDEAFEWVAAALAATSEGQPARYEALLARGDLEQKEGRLEDALTTVRTALAGFEALGDRKGIADSQRALGMAQLFVADVVAADASISLALDAYREIGDRGGEAWALQNLAWISFMAGRTDEAEARIGASAAMFTQVDDVGGIGWALGLLAYVRYHQGRFDEADLIAGYVLEESLERGDEWAVGMMRILLGSVRLWSGRTREAVEAARDAIAHFTDAGDVLSRTQATFLLARALLAAGQIGEAFETVGLTGLDEAGGILAGTSRETALLSLSVHLGAEVRALDAAVAAIDHDMDPSILGQSDELVTLALALVQAGRPAEALPLLGHVRAARTQPSMYGASVEALAHAALGDGAAARNAVEETLAGPSTYLDRLTAQLAALALAVHDPAAAQAAADELVQAADATTDLVLQGVTRCAAAAALVAAGVAPGDLAAEGRRRLAEVGVDGTGWLRAVGMAIDAGATEAAPASSPG